MNNLSWFIYIAQVSDGIRDLFLALSITGLIAVVGYLVMGTIIASAEADAWSPQVPRASFFAMALAGLIVGNLIPKKETMYAIAASEVGERLVKTETVSEIADEATKALRSWIKKQIEPEKAK